MASSIVVAAGVVVTLILSGCSSGSGTSTPTTSTTTLELHCSVRPELSCNYSESLDVESVIDAGDCCGLCQARDGCMAYTFVPGGDGQKSECYLKEMCDLIPYPGATAGVMTATTTTTQSLQCDVRAGFQCMGSTLLQKQIASDADACCSLCREFGGCKAYAYIEASKNQTSYCYLKDGCSSFKAYPEATSGLMIDSTTTQPSTGPSTGPTTAPTTAPSSGPITTSTSSSAPSTTTDGAVAHYGAPPCTNDDEEEIDVDGSVVCAAKCHHADDCPLDLPEGTTATRQCTKKRCSLKCSHHKSCPAGATCVKNSVLSSGGICAFDGSLWF